MDANYTDMLKCLNGAGVDYILVGGWAVNMYGYIRATVDLDIWILADIVNGLMAIPNLIALIALSGVVVAETKSYLAEEEASKNAKEALN